MPPQITSAKEKVLNHVTRHRAKYAFVAGATTATIVLNKMDRVAQFNAFLEEKGLTDEYYTPEFT
jgi:hypothetical protein